MFVCACVCSHAYNVTARSSNRGHMAGVGQWQQLSSGSTWLQAGQAGDGAGRQVAWDGAAGGGRECMRGAV